MVLGWVDLQVNGFNGVDFSSSSLKAEDIKFVSNELLKRGVVGYCPTIISSPLQVYERNIPLISEASKSGEGAQILGIHLEGPFINPEEGFRGAHLKANVIKPSIELFERFQSLAEDRIVILTLAPEQAGAMELINYITKTSNVTVSIGHANLSKELIEQAVGAGVKAATHVGNGIPHMIDRHRNQLWSLLAEDGLMGLFITDGFHLPKELIKVCLRAKGVSRFIVTSDVVHLAGKPPGEYSFHGIAVILEPNGLLHMREAPHLSGSTATMLECMNTMASLGELSETELQKIGYDNALQLIGREIDQNVLDQAPRIRFESEGFEIEEEN